MHVGYHGELPTSHPIMQSLLSGIRNPRDNHYGRQRQLRAVSHATERDRTAREELPLRFQFLDVRGRHQIATLLHPDRHKLLADRSAVADQKT